MTPTRLTPSMVAELTASGDWPNETFGDVLREQARVHPAKTAVVDVRTRLTYADLDRLVDEVAAGLRARSVAAGDAISCILPNRTEAVVLFYAAARLGAVLCPIVPIYGAHEIRFILRQTESVAAAVVERHGGVDFPAIVGRIAAEIPSLREIIVVGDTFPPGLRIPGPPPTEPADPNAVIAILYTSGTTAEPKGVLHTHNTLLSECRTTAAYHGLGADEVFVMASPVSHISGLLYGVLLPIVLGATSVLMERWDAGRFADLVTREGGTFSAGATPFLQGVVELPRHDLRSLRLFPCGGADVPPELIRRAMQRLGVRSGRGYGSTEFPSITSASGPQVPDAKRAETDGAPVGRNRIALRDEHGRAVPPGRPGEIWAWGPELCLGYRDPALDAEAFDADGWFRTGDLGVIDDDGYLTIVGRVKDIIVRGGEKLSAKEIEDLLFEHPAVHSVAVVPMPDAALGERVCAFVVPSDPANPPALADLVRFLEAREISRRKLPERLEVVGELPATASGKVQKHVLRERIARRLAEEKGSP
jgi:cyclohexanecarboxylate-CoA ligase